jgi:hypothetical protein
VCWISLPRKPHCRIPDTEDEVRECQHNYFFLIIFCRPLYTNQLNLIQTTIMEQLQLDLNNLSYDPDTDVSAGIQRQLKNRFAEKSKYKSGEKMVIKISGSEFVYAKNSNLHLKLKVTSSVATTFTFGQKVGSACNLVRRTRILAPDGACISDVQNLNAYAAISQRLYHSKDFTEVVGESYGWNETGANKPIGVELSFTIPLRMLSPFFNADALLPPVLTDGMTFEFYLENRQQAIRAGNIDQDYVISMPELALDTTRVSDGILNNITSRPMTYEFTDVVQSQTSMSGVDKQVYYEVPQSLTNATSAIALLRNSTALDAHSADGFLFIGPIAASDLVDDDDQMEWRVGSTLLPQQRAIGGARIYNCLLNARGMNTGTPTNFNIGRDIGYENVYGVYMCDLKRSHLYANSGRELSNGQRLSVFIKQQRAYEYQVDVFVQYICRVVLSGGRFEIER